MMLVHIKCLIVKQGAQNIEITTFLTTRRLNENTKIASAYLIYLISETTL
jgi:hypothetical protein